MKKSIIISLIILFVLSVNICSFAYDATPKTSLLGNGVATGTTILSNSFFNNVRKGILNQFSNAIVVARNTIAKVLEGFDIKVEPTGNGLKLGLGFNYDGNLVKISSSNDGVVSFDFKTMTLQANGDGETTLNVKIGEKNIPIKVAVKGGKISLNPEGKGVTFNGAGAATFDIENKNIATIDADTTTTAGITENGLEADMKAKQNVQILDKIKLNFNEGAGGKASLEGVEGNANGNVGVNGNEIASGDANVGYKKGETDPTLSLNATVLNQKLVGIKDQIIPLFTTIKKLFTNLLGR